MPGSTYTATTDDTCLLQIVPCLQQTHARHTGDRQACLESTRLLLGVVSALEQVTQSHLATPFSGIAVT